MVPLFYIAPGEGFGSENVAVEVLGIHSYMLWMDGMRQAE